MGSKRDTGSGPDEGWSAMMLKNMIQGGLARWHLPQTTLQVWVFSQELLELHCLTLWLVLTFPFEDEFAKSGRSLPWWLSLTFDLDLVFAELWLPSSFVSGVLLWDSGTQMPFPVVFALCHWDNSSHSVCFSILRHAQIQWWVLNGIYTEVRSASCEKKEQLPLVFFLMVLCVVWCDLWIIFITGLLSVTTPSIDFGVGLFSLPLTCNCTSQIGCNVEKPILFPDWLPLVRGIWQMHECPGNIS